MLTTMGAIFSDGKMQQPNATCDISGPILALDLGRKRVGVALSDELLITIRRLEPIKRSNWKQLLLDVSALAATFDAKTLVIGLPLSLDGNFGDSAVEARRTAQKFAQSLPLPVFLQDERLTSVEAKDNLRRERRNSQEISTLLDSEAAAIILRDFLMNHEGRTMILAAEEEKGDSVRCAPE